MILYNNNLQAYASLGRQPVVRGLQLLTNRWVYMLRELLATKVDIQSWRTDYSG